MRPDAVPSFVHVEVLGSPGDEIVLDPDASRYVARVCRAEVGSTIRATDGRGALARLTLVDVRPRVRALIDGVEHHERRRSATLWCGPPEGSRADWLVEKLAEIGVAVLQPVDTARGAWRVPPARLERWRRLSVAALGQSRQTWRMEIAPPRPLAALLVAGELPAARWLADPEGARSESPRDVAAVLGVVGGAGGLEAGERAELVASGFIPMSLAASRLRAETAALVWAAWWAGGAI